MKFENSNLIQTITSVDKPVLYINKIVFVTNDTNWASRLFGASLTIKFLCIDKDKREGKSSSEPLSFGTFITPYHRKPVMEINRLFSFTDHFKFTDDSECKQWQVIIGLNNLTFEQNESLEVFITDHTKLTIIDKVISEIERLKNKFGSFSSSTKDLLSLIPHLRLDWSQTNNGFSDEFNIGASKPILLSGLINPEHKMKRSNLLFENSKIAQLLVDTFLIEKKLTANLLKEIHQQIIRDGGIFRTQDVIISDKNKTINPPFSTVSEIHSNLESLVDWYNKEVSNDKMHPLILSSIFHYNLVKIHPFLDGNGRLARVIASLILLSFNIPPPFVKPEDRVEYLNTLRNADSGDVKPLIIFIGNRIIKSMNYALILKHNSDD